MSTWPDLSPYGNDAVQVIEGYQPVLVDTSAGPAVQFDGVNDHFVVEHHTSLDVYVQDAAIIGVYAHQTDAFSGDNIGVVYYKGMEGSPSTGLGLEANWLGETRAAFSVQDPPGGLLSSENGYNDNTLRMISGYRFATNQAELRVDGVVDQSQTVPYADMNTTRNGFIGSQVRSNGVVWQPLDGIIAELIIVTPVTRDELEMVEDHLRAKYALPAASPLEY